jgi:multisubunit Na+/H+ antiporter MnhC subunit
MVAYEVTIMLVCLSVFVLLPVTTQRFIMLMRLMSSPCCLCIPLSSF